MFMIKQCQVKYTRRTETYILIEGNHGLGPHSVLLLAESVNKQLLE
jgi:hypothetical protein